ncbi:MAG TPA: hypothetical protein VIM11_20540 [Tepidisphaeraceae bacterium]|jgi:hypothetical protein
MQDPETLNPPDFDLPNALRRLQPTAPQSSQRDIWYRAGLAAGRRRVNIWRSAAAAMTLVATLLLATAHRSSPTAPQQQIAQRQSPSQSAVPDIDQSTTNSTAAYARLRATITRDGFAALSSSDPPSSNGTPPPPSRHDSPGFNDSDFLPANLTPQG